MATIVSLPEGVAKLTHDGMTVSLEGFSHLVPMHADHELIWQRLRDLTVVRMVPDVVTDQLIGAGCLRKLVFGWAGNPGVGSLHRFRDAVENDCRIRLSWRNTPTPVSRIGSLRARRGCRSPYAHPRVRLPGAGGAPEIASGCGRTVVMIRQTKGSFVERVDFVSTLGHGQGDGERASFHFPGAGPAAVVTDLGVYEPDPETRELVLTGLQPGATVEQVREQAGWHVEVSPALDVLPEPTSGELAILDQLA
jgi:Coenzyme A transferase